jgi:hypothetical protein
MRTKVIYFNQVYRNSRLLTDIMQRLRVGHQTKENWSKLTYLARKNPNSHFDIGIYTNNYNRNNQNHRHVLEYAMRSEEPIFVCLAKYSTDNEEACSWLKSVPSKNFDGNCHDALLLSRGIKVSLLTNINTKCGLTNGTVGTVIDVIYEPADVPNLLKGQHPFPYAVIVEFPEYRGPPFTHSNAKLPQDNWVVIHMRPFKLDLHSHHAWKLRFPSLSIGKNTTRTQFPLDIARNFTIHKAQGQTWKDEIIEVSMNGAWRKGKDHTDITSMLYVACTRSNTLQNLFVRALPLERWLELGKSPFYKRKIAEIAELKRNAISYMRMHGSRLGYPLLYQQLNEIDVSDAAALEEEWRLIQLIDITIRPPENIDTNGVAYLYDCIRPASQVLRCIAFDLGAVNTGMCVLSQDLSSKKPTIELLTLLNLHLGQKTMGRQTYNHVMNCLNTYGQVIKDCLQEKHAYLASSTYITVLLEQSDVHNPWQKYFEKALMDFVTQHASKNVCLLKKLSQASNLHDKNGPIHLLNLPPTFNSTIRIPDTGEPLAKQPNYTKRKQVSSQIVRFIRDEDLKLYPNFNLNVMPRVISDISSLRKLDDVGDALLHALRETLMTPSNYRPVIAAAPAFPGSRCVCLFLTERHLLAIVLTIQSNNYIFQHILYHEWKLPNAYDLTIKTFIPHLPDSLYPLLDFTTNTLPDTTLIRIIIRQGTSARGNRLHHSLFKEAMVRRFQSESAFTRVELQRTRAGVRNVHHYTDGCLRIVEHSVGRHTDAQQILPNILSTYESFAPISENVRPDIRLTEPEKLCFFNHMLNASDHTNLVSIEHLQISTNVANQLRLYTIHAARISDLLLVACDKSTVRSQFSGQAFHRPR